MALNSENALVFVKGDTVLANSRHVAEVLGKRHDNVLVAVDNLDCSDEFRLLNFKETCEIKEIGTSRRKLRSIDMTKDGFTFLVMGFTGSTAARFKEAYIAAFNAMELELRNPQRKAPEFQGKPSTAEALRLVSETRKSFGTRAAQHVWMAVGLPVVPAMLEAMPQMEFKLVMTPANQNLPIAA